MSDWQEYRIGDHIHPISGFPFASDKFTNDGGVPLIRIRDLVSSETEVNYSGKFSDAFLVENGDILIGMDGDFNIVKWKGGKALLNQRLLKLVEKSKSELALEYIFYWLIPYLLHVNNITAATTVKHLSTADVTNAIVKGPARKEQKKIAKILTTVDSLIEKTEALIEKYQAIKQGMMHDLFTRGIDTNGQLRPSHHDAPHLYKQMELGWIPKEWETDTVGNYLVRIEQGWSPDCLAVPAPVGEWGVLKTTAVTWDGYDSQKNKSLPSTLFPRAGYEIQEGDILMTRAGPNSRVGVIAQVNLTQPKLMLSDKLYRLVPNKEIDASYLAIALASHLTQQNLSTYKTGLAESQTNISQAIVRKLLINVPNVDEQKEIVIRIATITKKLRAEQISLKKAHLVKKGLMQDLLTGKVRVTRKEII